MSREIRDYYIPYITVFRGRYTELTRIFRSPKAYQIQEVFAQHSDTAGADGGAMLFVRSHG